MPGANSIDHMGYGRIYKSAMRNSQLPLLAKAVYAYLCAYAGSGYTAYPKRDKILRDLKINKDTHTKHLRQLICAGYVSRRRTAAGNIYTIEQTINRHDAAGLPTVENIAAQGYGTLPKAVMLNMSLTAQAKAIYAYFASFSGASGVAFPRRATVLRDLNLSVNTYYEHFNMLLAEGYISAQQTKSSGRFGVALYRICGTTMAEPAGAKEQAAVQKKEAQGKKYSAAGAKTKAAAPVSEKLEHGIDFCAKDAMYKEEMSEKESPQKMMHSKTGHANNINNSFIKNISLKKEQIYNHGFAPDGKNALNCFSIKQVKDLIGYEELRLEAVAWAEIKERLGHFAREQDKLKYTGKAIGILNATAARVRDTLNSSEQPQLVLDILKSDEFFDFYGDMLDRCDEIRSVKGYVSVALKNKLTRMGHMVDANYSNCAQGVNML